MVNTLRPPRLTTTAQQAQVHYVKCVTITPPTHADTEYYPYNSGRTAFFPLLFSSAGYGLFIAVSSYGSLRVAPSPATTVFNASAAPVIELWVTTTPATPVYAAGTPHPMLSLLRQYADAVGHAPLMPSWAAGFIASKDRYHNQSQFLAVAHGYLDRGIPLSVLTIDWWVCGRFTEVRI